MTTLPPAPSNSSRRAAARRGCIPIVDFGDGPEVDLGFKVYRALGPTAKLTTKDIVRLDEDGVRKVDNATKDQLFTYTTTIRKVVDGDTLDVALTVAPGYTHRLKLRLYGLDVPSSRPPPVGPRKRSWMRASNPETKWSSARRSPTNTIGIWPTCSSAKR